MSKLPYASQELYRELELARTRLLASNKTLNERHVGILIMKIYDQVCSWPRYGHRYRSTDRVLGTTRLSSAA